MSKTTYKRLGDYIHEVNVRNRELKVETLVGLSISKEFIPSVANTIGTDMSTYKIIKQNQFACSLMQVSRDGKIPIAMLEIEEAIMSPAYPIFEVINTNILLPKYLMLWFSRSEFDREASYYAVGGVRGSLTWEDFCDMKLPIPSIEKQKEIVNEYEVLSNRIALNESICENLEQTAQALYRKMFVDDIDPENLPVGWRKCAIGELVIINDRNRKKSKSNEVIRYLDSSSVTKNIFQTYQNYDTSKVALPSRAQRLVQNGDIIYSTVRPNLCHFGMINETNIDDIVVSTAFSVIRSKYKYISNTLLYLFLTDKDTVNNLQNIAEMSKATYPSILTSDIEKVDICVPLNWLPDITKTQEVLVDIYKHISIIHKELLLIEKSKTLLLSKITSNKIPK